MKNQPQSDFDPSVENSHITFIRLRNDTVYYSYFIQVKISSLTHCDALESFSLLKKGAKPFCSVMV